MKRNLLVLLLVGTILFSWPVLAWSAGSGDIIRDQAGEQDQVQIHQQDRDRISFPLADQEQAQLLLREKLYILDEAQTKMQDRLRDRDQTHLCFNDLELHWARQQIQNAYYWGLAVGYPDGSFEPNGVVKGAEAVIMLSRLMNCTYGIDEEDFPPGNIDWELVPAWARERLQEPAALRIASQIEYYGEEPVTRLNFAMMLARGLDIELAAIPEEAPVFWDQDQIPAEELGFVLALNRLGIINGDHGEFCPDRLVTRAEATVMLNRVLDVLE